MSQPPKGEELPKTGKELPSAGTRRERANDFARAVAEALKQELARGTPIKTIMSWTGAGERTVKGWLRGSNGPSGEHLECLLRSSEAVYTKVMLRTGRHLPVTRQSLAVLKMQLNSLSGAIDAALAGNVLAE
jgi:hypothetical protein